MSGWTIDRARQTYSIPRWAEGYFDVNASGQVVVRPRGEGGPTFALADVVTRARRNGARLPLLLRFPDILVDRLSNLHRAFAQAMQDLDYAGGYTAVYPVKVNQHRAVAGALVTHDGGAFGLEAGSKPELMAVLGLSQPGGLIVCNGYKDREYIRLALIGRKLGFDTHIVIEKPSELPIVLEEAERLGVVPAIGARMRLASLGAGRWQNSGGDKAKFGLGPRQMLDLWKHLCEAGRQDCLALLHFHMGSQMSNVRDIANGMREATRHFVELSALGAHVRYMDVGGGLGVDYEGTQSQGRCSVNYSVRQYASNIVQPLAEACREHGLRPPHVITECGRAMTAHHAVLVANVSDVERADPGRVRLARPDDPPVVRHLHQLHASLDARSPAEIFREAEHHHAEGQALYALGAIDLESRATVEDLFSAIAHAVRHRLQAAGNDHPDLRTTLSERQVDKYFVNFSIFESIPDSWAIGQVFPIVPIERLHEAPATRATLADLTCDSDGAVSTFVENETLSPSLPLHLPRPGESYLLGFFMVGAYQEVLGDIHNLFGDTDAVEAHIDGDGFRIDGQRRGDAIDAILEYVGYSLVDLRARYSDRIVAAKLGENEAMHLTAALDAGLAAYTYLEEDPGACAPRKTAHSHAEVHECAVVSP